MPEFDSSLEYRPIEGFPGYCVGNDGSIWSNKFKRWRQLKPRIGRFGYHRVVLYPSPKGHFVHRLVLTAFGGECPKGQECRHLDGNRSNNIAGNLKWGTRRENAQDAIGHGTYAKGERQHKAVLTESLVLKLRDEHKNGASQISLVKKYGLKEPTVSHVICRRTWKHI